MNETMTKMVAAIRADEKLGRGSCSAWDECYSDEELAEALERANVKTVKAALAFCRKIEKIRNERERDTGGW